MLDNEMQRKRDNQIEDHRKKDTKQHQYPIRLDDTRYAHLKEMGESSTMSEVVNCGIDTEWEYFMTVKRLMNDLPNLKSIEDVQRWRAIQFKSSPELLAKYVTPAAIMAYTTELEKTRATNRLLLDSQDTIAYLIKNIGNNINQLARQANSGIAVSRDELARVTKAVIKLSKTIEATEREVT